METIVLIVFRLVATCIFAAGAVWLASKGQAGWGWCIFTAIVLGGITISTDKGKVTDWTAHNAADQQRRQ